uniref:ATP synthase F(0) complex subunit e, mitochondrial n=1 Tax=Culicoides sonorensis TaxID=179676 RepID=A0A336KME4_CULSO
MADLGTPVRVSPLIKFGRWSFLAVGVAYGAYHQSRLSKKAGKEREIEAQKKLVRDAQLAEEKKRAAEREAAEWEKLSAPAPKK